MEFTYKNDPSCALTKVTLVEDRINIYFYTKTEIRKLKLNELSK